MNKELRAWSELRQGTNKLSSMGSLRHRDFDHEQA